MEVGTRENPEITRTYGGLLEASQARLKDLTLEQFEPAKGTIVVKQFQAETLTEGGIHLPTIATKKPALGTVVAVNRDTECPYEVGDIVVIRSANCGTPIALGKDDEYLVLQYRGEIDDEVLGRFSKEAVAKSAT